MERGLLRMSGALASVVKSFGNSLPTDHGEDFPWLRAAPLGIPWNLVPLIFRTRAMTATHPLAAAPVADSTHLLGFSEILLHILSHVPSTDLWF